MSDATDELEAAVLALPRDKRAELAELLLDSLDEDSEVDAAWRNTIRKRLEAYRHGELSSDDAESVLEDARNRIDE